jgi:hypothetical protein
VVEFSEMSRSIVGSVSTTTLRAIRLQRLTVAD